MAINLGKGQAVDLTKNRVGLSKITVGLSWGSTSSSTGFLAALFGRVSDNMDIDSSVVVVGEGKKRDLVYYNNLTSSGIRHKGDDLTGNDKKGAHDNEEIEIDLDLIPGNVDKLIFIANIYQGEDRNQHFGQVKGAYIRVLTSGNREELIRFELSEDYNKMRGLVVGELYRNNGEWKFKAVGQGTSNSNLTSLEKLALR